MFRFFLLIAVAYSYHLPAEVDLKSNPWLLNVYALGSIGKPSAYYGSDFQGIAGAGGDAFFSNFSLNSNNTPSSAAFALFTGGNVNLNSGSFNNGGVEAGGNIYLNNASVKGNISSGGDLSGNSGQISGQVTLAGKKNSGANLVIHGALQQNQAYTALFDHANASDYFTKASKFWSELSSTATTSSQYGLISVHGLTSGRNIVNLSLADINNSYGIALNGPADAFVIFNIDGQPIAGKDAMKALSLQLNGGISFDDILFNLVNAQTISLQGGNYTSLLAPLTDVTFSSGLLTGNLIANNLYGAGQVNSGYFTGYQLDQKYFTTAPEPMTWLLLASMLILVAMRRGALHS